MAPAMRSGLAAVGAVALTGVVGDVFQIDMYRAMSGGDADAHVTQDDDLASLGGVLEYIHTEPIVESSNNQNRWERHYSINAVLKRRFKVKNPEALLNKQFTDWGSFITFDIGQSTNKDMDATFETVGDFVGIQGASRAGWTAVPEDPAFWYSVSGFCPNLLWTPGVQTLRCRQEKLCEAKGSPEAPNAKCLKYAGSGDIVKGGFCGDAKPNATVPAKDPTGDQGCVYTYGNVSTVTLDEVVGITQMKCNGGKKCEDWLDFRKNCDDGNLRFYFNFAGDLIPAKNKTPQAESFCTEYDIHPECNKDCFSKACQKVEQKEVGIPFWLGRCDPKANARRNSQLAVAFDIEGAADAHATVHKDILDEQATCKDPKLPICVPNDVDGGPYCHRGFSGVCQTCSIPLKGKIKPAFTGKPMCPLDVLQQKDYEGTSQTCKSTDASDLCCLYTGTCDGSDDPSEATLDQAGLAMVAARCAKEKSSEPMLSYIARLAKETFKADLDTQDKAVRELAYDSWGLTPQSINFTEVSRGVKAHLAPAPQPSPAPAPAPSHGGGGSAGTVILVVVVVAAVLGIAGAGAYFYRQRQGARRPLLDQQGAMA